MSIDKNRLIYSYTIIILYYFLLPLLAMSTHKKEVHIHHSQIIQAMANHLRGRLLSVLSQGHTEVNSAQYKDLLRHVQFPNEVWPSHCNDEPNYLLKLKSWHYVISWELRDSGVIDLMQYWYCCFTQVWWHWRGHHSSASSTPSKRSSHCWNNIYDQAAHPDSDY